MMEKSDEYEISMNTGALSKARADVSERQLEDASYAETYEPLRADLQYLEEASPESNRTGFKPGKFSSPTVENGVPDVHQHDSGFCVECCLSLISRMQIFNGQHVMLVHSTL